MVYVVARDPAGFLGADLVRLVSDQGLTFGEMNIFHHYVADRPQYSMASAVAPGTFDLAAIDDTSLAGVAFFLRLPGPANPVDAFEHLIGVAQQIAEQLGGELRDEQRSSLTRQGIELARERIRLFERRATHR